MVLSLINLSINYRKKLIKPYLNDLLILIIVLYFNSAIVNNIVISLSLTAILIFTIKIINNAKLKALNESLVFSDIALFSQVFFYPRLYLPFLNLKLILFILPFIFIIIYLFIYYLPTLKLTDSYYFLSIFLILSILFELYYIKKIDFIDNIACSINKYGLLTHLLKGLEVSIKEVNSKNFINNLNQKSYLKNINKKKLLNKPIIITIQSESFFNPEKLQISYKNSILPTYKNLLQEAYQYGELQVPAWGANTMRSEFAFLSAIPNNLLGAIRYYPYLFLNSSSLVTLPNYLKQQDYYCICIHPYPSGFFRRNKVFKHLGFDLFLDIKQFQATEKFGAYISDQAVALKIIECIKSYTDKPLFIFSITMENHGPLHLEAVTQNELHYFLKPITLKNPHNLIAYLRHLANADKMLQLIIQYLKQYPKPSTLCFYGDHVPSMPDIYKELNYSNSNTNYFIWHSYKKAAQQNDRKIDIAELAKYLVESL
jgi:phosphoglycerol transferase MdoB-like AlkP superfamily enzyme